MAGQLRSINPKGIDQALRGPLMIAEQSRLGKLLMGLARSIVPLGQNKGKGRKPHLFNSFSFFVRRTAAGVVATIRCRAPHAIAVHQGAPPHPIPKTPRPVGRPIHFWKVAESKWVHVRQVQHPGSKPNPFLIDAARRLGFTKVRWFKDAR